MFGHTFLTAGGGCIVLLRTDGERPVPICQRQQTRLGYTQSRRRRFGTCLIERMAARGIAYIVAASCC